MITQLAMVSPTKGTRNSYWHVWYIYTYMHHKNQPNVGAKIVSKKNVSEEPPHGG